MALSKTNECNGTRNRLSGTHRVIGLQNSSHYCGILGVHNMNMRFIVRLLIALGFIALGTSWIFGPGTMGPGIGTIIVGVGLGASSVYLYRRQDRPTK